ncbi:AbrB/MazE/SpoVT family DNA-binding domain-containing protein [Hathewaya histolytica]|uniref:SpoVT-AbrB domain-containing protein n=1 Tax=Hathewaya histolytica TaxID=1498 RepID=A0A4U9RBD8_HATHI|nr:AbrB/MazE/SpoVT family DNA-binding domain-containing protein [Hathewaya histolytica]VTQ88839.1 Uncharacterised protein [Hathewaya histolytica]
MENKDIVVLSSTSGSGSTNYRIGIPADWARALNLEKGTVLHAIFDGEHIALRKKNIVDPVVLEEIKKFIDLYNNHEGEKIFCEQITPIEAVSSRKADSIELVEGNGYFSFLFKFGEREIQGQNIEYSKWNISTKIEDGKYTLCLVMV